MLITILNPGFLLRFEPWAEISQRLRRIFKLKSRTRHYQSVPKIEEQILLDHPLSLEVNRDLAVRILPSRDIKPPVWLNQTVTTNHPPTPSA